MTEAARSRRVAAPPTEVWARLADFGAISAWAPNVDHSSMLRSDDGHDTDVGATRRVQVGRMALLERVVHCDEGAALGYDVEGLPKIVRSARNEWCLEPDGANTTTVTLTSTVDCGPRPPQKLIARIVARRMATDGDKMLTGLADSLERPHD